LTRIVTQLGKDAVLAALRELAPATHNSRLFQSTFEGRIDPQRLLIAYRFGWFVPPVRLTTFTGRIREAGDGTEIEGIISSNWIVYLLAGWLLVAAPISLYRYASVGEYSTVLWTLVTVAVLLFLGRAFIRSTQRYVVDEIGRAVRGKVSQN
jgi:hypothetical protein